MIDNVLMKIMMILIIMSMLLMLIITHTHGIEK